MRSPGVLFGVCLAATLTSACSPAPPEIVVGIGEDIFPAYTLTDWVSYGLQVSVITVVAEEESSTTTPSEADPYVGRLLTIRIDEDLWVNPDGFEPASGEIQFYGAGWVLQGGRKVRFALEYCPRLEVGARYVLPLTLYPSFSLSPRGPLGGEAVLPVPGDALAEKDAAAYGMYGVAKELAGRPIAELQAALERTPVDPAVAPYLSLPPYERWLAVSGR